MLHLELTVNLQLDAPGRPTWLPRDGAAMAAVSGARRGHSGHYDAKSLMFGDAAAEKRLRMLHAFLRP